MTYKEIITELKEIRKGNGLTLADVCEQTGIHKTCLSMYETGKRTMPMGHFLRIVEYIGADILVTEKQTNN
ncbi:MAG: helix-turn-helix transcriptional regulator [Bacteroidaceae bacterium]|nr:helix-turn-helix transcriptional regulator [Bacteroidaceae bacterium]